MRRILFIVFLAVVAAVEFALGLFGIHKAQADTSWMSFAAGMFFWGLVMIALFIINVRWLLKDKP